MAAPILPTIPNSLEEWNLDILNKLVELRDIESETFDFKGNKSTSLEEHICAMANTSGGFVVLGVDQIKEGSKVTGFRKNGFDKGMEDEVELNISNYRYQVEPTPIVNVRHIPDGNKFYTVVMIESNDDKPYFTRNSGQCYIRIGSSSKPATRTMIINLLTNKVVSSEERRRHSILLCEVYRRLIDASPHGQRDQTLTITVPRDYQRYHESLVTLEAFNNPSSIEYVDVSKIDYFEWALEHLQHEEYVDILSKWKTINQQLEDYNSIAKHLKPKLEALIKTRLKKAYPKFSAVTDDLTVNEDSGQLEWGQLGHQQIFPAKLAQVLIPRIFETTQGQEPRFASLERRPYGQEGKWIVTLEGHQIMNLAEKDDIDIEKLRKILVQTCKNDDLVSNCKALQDLLSDLHKTTIEFSKVLKQLVKDIEGGYLLKGKCKLQY